MEKHSLHFKWFLNALGLLRILSAKWSEKSFIGHRPQPFVIHRSNPLYSPWEHCVQYLRLTDTFLNASFSGFVFPQAWHTDVASASESCAHCLHVQDSTVCLRSKASCAVYVANKKYLGMLRLLNMQATWKKHMQTCKHAHKQISSNTCKPHSNTRSCQQAQQMFCYLMALCVAAHGCSHWEPW